MQLTSWSFWRLLLLLLLTTRCSLAHDDDDNDDDKNGDDDDDDPEYLDLSYPYDSKVNCHPKAAYPFRYIGATKKMDPRGFWYQIESIETTTHCGTHLDSPCHFSKDKWSVDEIPLDRLMHVPAVVVDVTEECEKDRDYQVTDDDLREWEEEHGEIPEDSILLIRTGWSKYWYDRARYGGNPDIKSTDLHHPGVHKNASNWLVEHRSIVGLGIDTFSVDNGQSNVFDTHQIMSSHNIYNLENVNVSDSLPATGFSLYILPLKFTDGSGSPVRIIAAIDNGVAGLFRILHVAAVIVGCLMFLFVVC